MVLIDFWTYTCINCIRTLPYLKAWDATYRKDGLTIVGVETPEFAFEHDASNVASAIKSFGIRYPVAQDNEYGTWNAYENQYWPADYLIDSKGDVRYVAFGEGDYEKTESAIRALLALAGHQVGGKSHATGVIVPSHETTPETYLGTERGQGWVSGPLAGLHDYGAQAPANLALNDFAYSGTWRTAGQPALAIANAGIDAEVQAKNVYLVLSKSQASSGKVEVLLDGHPIAPADAGADVHDGHVTVSGERLYSLVVAAPRPAHALEPALRPRGHGLLLHVRIGIRGSPSKAHTMSRWRVPHPRRLLAAGCAATAAGRRI